MSQQTQPFSLADQTYDPKIFYSLPSTALTATSVAAAAIFCPLTKLTKVFFESPSIRGNLMESESKTKPQLPRKRKKKISSNSDKTEVQASTQAEPRTEMIQDVKTVSAVRRKKKKRKAESSAEKPALTARESTSKHDEDQPVLHGSSGIEQAVTNVSSNIEADEVSFSSLGLVPALCQATEVLGWKKPSAIQCEALPYGLQRRDLIALAETGSGKTGAFVLPILQALLESGQRLFALILAPTRELAFQISEQVDGLGSGIGVQCATIIGGVDMMSQAIALAKKPHVIVATPGRIADHLENTKGFHLRQLQFLVLDEADRLLNMDFEKEIDKILEVVPKERTTFLFSATMTTKVAKLQRASLSDPVKVSISSSKYQTVSTLRQEYIFLPAKYKDCYLVYVLNELAGNTSIIFCSTCEHTQRVALMLRNLGFGTVPLHGKMSQTMRLGALNKFKSGNSPILLATDVASRGLDIPTVDLVINCDIPTHSKDYIHRVGRTARAGRSGRAITLVTQYDVELFQRIEHLIGQKMKEYPTHKDSVLLLLERVAEAQRIAAMDLRDQEAERSEKKRNKSGGNRFKNNAAGNWQRRS
eukprot:g57661.t1